SLEKICVRKINFIFYAWFSYYGVPLNNYNSKDLDLIWNTVLMISIDGLDWSRPIALNFSGLNENEINIHYDFAKDPDVVYVNGVFYMYLLYGFEMSPTVTYVFTSNDGINFLFGGIIDTNYHAHSSILFDDDT